MPKKGPGRCKCGYAHYSVVRRTASYVVIECCSCLERRKTAAKRVRPDCCCGPLWHERRRAWKAENM